jgi:hypothetical protein
MQAFRTATCAGPFSGSCQIERLCRKPFVSSSGFASSSVDGGILPPNPLRIFADMK